MFHQITLDSVLHSILSSRKKELFMISIYFSFVFVAYSIYSQIAVNSFQISENLTPVSIQIKEERKQQQKEFITFSIFKSMCFLFVL